MCVQERSEFRAVDLNPQQLNGGRQERPKERRRGKSETAREREKNAKEKMKGAETMLDEDVICKPTPPCHWPATVIIIRRNSIQEFSSAAP